VVTADLRAERGGKLAGARVMNTRLPNSLTAWSTYVTSSAASPERLHRAYRSLVNSRFSVATSAIRQTKYAQLNVPIDASDLCREVDVARPSVSGQPIADSGAFGSTSLRILPGGEIHDFRCLHKPAAD
jgi:hypothetical protein